MTHDEYYDAMLEVVGKYDRGIFTEDDAREALWRLAQQADDESRRRVSVSSQDD